jgi:hypothetical protein
MKRLKEIWKNRRLIWQGFINTILVKRHVEEVAAKRLEICMDCDELDVEGKNCAVPKTQPCCSECGCSLAYKTRSLEASCPLSYWVAVGEEEEEIDEQ